MPWLFLYLRFFFFLAVVLLIIGGNMPEQIAERLNISKIPLLLALAAMIGISLINYVVKLMPTGLEPRRKEKSPEGVRAMFYAVEKNNIAYAQKVLQMNFDPNLHHDNGYTPLAYAAMKGNPQMVELFVRHGADPAMTTREGDTAVELALRMGHTEVADTLKRARQEMDARAAEPVTQLRDRKGNYRKELQEMRNEGFVRARIDNAMADLTQEIILEKKKRLRSRSSSTGSS